MAGEEVSVTVKEVLVTSEKTLADIEDLVVICYIH